MSVPRPTSYETRKRETETCDLAIAGALSYLGLIKGLNEYDRLCGVGLQLHKDYEGIIPILMQTSAVVYSCLLLSQVLGLDTEHSPASTPLPKKGDLLGFRVQV